MDAVKFIKEINRLCEAQEDCKDCPLIGHACDVNTATIMSCYNIESVQNMVQIVEQWVKDNPVKTRQSEFLKQFPNADLTRLQPCIIEKDKRPMWCGKYADFGANGCCDECRYAYWNEEVTDND
jgi:hypothetical protein